MKNILCSLFGHRLSARSINIKRQFAECIRCEMGLKLSYDMSYGETIVVGDHGDQKTFCWCDCGNELCSSGSYQSMCYSSNGNFERYKCSKCGAESKWDFDAPCPIKVEI